MGPPGRPAGSPHPRLPRPDPRDPARPVPGRAGGAAAGRCRRGQHHAAVALARRAELRARRGGPPGAQLPAHDARVGLPALCPRRSRRAVRRRRRGRRPARRKSGRGGAARCAGRAARGRDGAAGRCRGGEHGTAVRGAGVVRRARCRGGGGGAPDRDDLPVALLPQRRPPRPIGYQGGRRAGLGFVVAGADNGTYSATLAVDADDAELRAHLLDPDRYEAVLPLFREMEPVVRRGGTPITPVQAMGGLVNRIRRFLDPTGAPLAHGFFAVGDAHTCTNPLYGRGSSLAVLQAVLVADALAAHPDDPDAAARAYEAASAARVEPWYDVSVLTDAAARATTGPPPPPARDASRRQRRRGAAGAATRSGDAAADRGVGRPGARRPRGPHHEPARHPAGGVRRSRGAAPAGRRRVGERPP